MPRMLLNKRTAPTLLGWGVLLLLVLLIVLPLLAVLIQIFLPGIFFGELNFAGFGLVFDIFERKLWSKSLTNSLLLAAGTTVFGTLLGTMLAILRSTYHLKSRIILDFTAWALLIMPSFIIAQGWVLFASGKGIAVTFFGLEWVPSFIFHPIGLIFIMTLCKFPYAYLAVTAALEWNMNNLIAAARLNGANSWNSITTVQIPLLMPSLLSGAALIFMDAIGDFGLPASLAAVYSFPTLSYSIYSALYTAPIRFDMAGVLSFYLVLIIFIVMAIQLWALRKGSYSYISGQSIRKNAIKVRFGWLIDGFVVCCLIIMLGIPIGSSIVVSFMDTLGNGISLNNFTFRHYQQFFSVDSATLEGFFNSISIALLAGILGLIIGLLIGYVLVFTDFKYRKWIDSISVISLAVPGVVLGIGYIFIWNQQFLEAIHLKLYGTPAILVLASVAGAIPIAARLMIGAVTKILPSQLNAAALQGAGFFKRMQSILIPLLRSSLLTAGLTAFGTSIFDLAITSILYPPNYITLPVAINKAFEDLNYGYATAATIISGSLVIVIMMAFKWFIEKGFTWLAALGKKERKHVINRTERIKEV
ncbi:ABC transporter permease [Bacillus sp. 7586-K]|uniref:ABC transporter permease n=1 Tax=Metabacillus niabensis TaxID=324854 RepID=UPI00201E0511